MPNLDFSTTFLPKGEHDTYHVDANIGFGIVVKNNGPSAVKFGSKEIKGGGVFAIASRGPSRYPISVLEETGAQIEVQYHFFG